MKPKQIRSTFLLFYSGLLTLQVFGCNGTQQKATQSAIQTLHETIDPASSATISSSTEVDWKVGFLPWDRLTLPVISSNGLNAAVQLGPTPSIDTLLANTNDPVDSTSIEMHSLDPVHGMRTPPSTIEQTGLLLSRFANDHVFFVESPRGEKGRWIGEISWSTGALTWLVDDDSINAFPTSNVRGDLAWSRQRHNENRFHLVIQTAHNHRSIDDGESDWVFPLFLGKDRLRVFRINNGKLSLVELDLGTTDPLLTAMSLPLLGTGGSRAVAMQIATTNLRAVWQTTYAFYHPQFQRMTIWEPDALPALRYLARKSVAAAPVGDGSWIVATDKRVLRQSVDEHDGIHVRNQLAIPVATTSTLWTHLLLEPRGNRLHVHAVNLNR